MKKEENDLFIYKVSDIVIVVIVFFYIGVGYWVCVWGIVL